MNDLISRQAAIDVLKNRWKKTRNYEGNGDDIAEECELYLKQVPSAQPDLSGYSGRLWKAAYERGKAEAQQRWIPCSEWLPEEYGEYRITWVTSLVPSKRFIGDSEYEVTSVWDEERKGFKGEWLLDDYIKNYPDVKVIAWKPLEEPYREEGD